MKTIWKYVLSRGTSHIRMPVGAYILTVQTQDEKPVMWAIVDPDQPMEVRVFEIIGTGHPVSDVEKKYINTFQVQVQGGTFVFHVFELKAVAL